MLGDTQKPCKIR